MRDYDPLVKRRQEVLRDALQEMARNNVMMEDSNQMMVTGFTCLVNLLDGDGEEIHCFITGPDDRTKTTLGDVDYMKLLIDSIVHQQWEEDE